jgi:anti-anti-sigma factor
MELKIEKLSNGIRQVTLTGRLDIKGTNEIDTDFNAQVHTSKTAVLVDMSKVDFLASIGIRLLLSSARALDRRGGKMILFNPKPLVEDVLNTAGVNQLIDISHDYDQACAILKAAVPD